MPGILNTSISTIRSGAKSWSSYWKSLNPTLWVKENSRSGLTLTDSVSGNNPTILPAYLYKSQVSEYMYVQDNGALDIGGNDFTFIANVMPASTYTANYQYICGKAVQGVVNGKYMFYAEVTTGYYHAYVVSSGGATDIASTIQALANTPVHLRLDINQTTKKIRFFINNVQQGVDTSYTGTFAALNNTYGLCLGTGQATGGAYNYLPSYCNFSDVFIFNRVLSPADALIAYNRGNPTGSKAHYPLLGISGYKEANLNFNIYGDYDASGNGYHLTGVGITSVNIRFSSFGSRHGLDVGYTLYTNGYNDVYVPFTDAGTEIVSPPVLTGFTKVANHAGDSMNHNLSNSKIQFVGSEWDRSDATRWGASARVYSATDESTYYDSTSATTKKQWHIVELVNLQMNLWGNAGYERQCVVYISDHSYGYRKKLKEIGVLTANLAQADYNKVLNHYGDYSSTGIYENENMYWKWDTSNVIAVQGTKVLKYTSGYVWLSVDDGLTFPYSYNLVGMTQCQFGYIFINGNILFATPTKIYLSTDNLSTVTEVVPTGADGNPFVASSQDNFNANDYPKGVVIGGKEYLVWGNYSNTDPIRYINMNVWFTNDNGVHIKSIYKVNYTAPILTFKHYHGVAFNPANNHFLFVTGDAEQPNDCRWVDFYTSDDGATWTFTQIANGDDTTYYKNGGSMFYNNVFTWGLDSGTTKHGIWYCNVSDMATPANFHQKYVVAGGVYRLYSAMFDVNSGKALWDGTSLSLGNVLISSNDSLVTLKGNRIYGLPLNTTPVPISNPKTDGWGYIKTFQGSSSYDWSLPGNGVLWYKLK